MLCVFGAVLCIVGQCLSQTVITSINLEDSTGIQVENSTAVLNFELIPEEIILYWTFDNVNIYVCQITRELKCGCNDITDGSSFSKRLNGSCKTVGSESAFLVLNFGPISKNDSFNVSIRSNLGDINNAGSVTFVVLEDCLETNAIGVNTTFATPCGFECNKNFSCLDGFVGSATGNCQENATFTYENNCTEITCPILPSIECGCGNCTLETSASVQFNNTIDMKCQEGCTGKPQAKCSSSGTLQLDEGCTLIQCSYPVSANLTCKGTDCPNPGEWPIDGMADYNTSLFFDYTTSKCAEVAAVCTSDGWNSTVFCNSALGNQQTQRILGNIVYQVVLFMLCYYTLL